MRAVLAGIIQDMQDRPNPALFLDGKRLERPEPDDYEALAASEAASERKTLTAIDGGSAPIVQTPHTCVVFARIITLTMQADMQKKIVKTEGFLVANAQETDVRVILHELSGKKRELCTLKTEELPSEEAAVVAACGIGRRLLEWEHVSAAQDAGLVVWDGSFTAHTTCEGAALKKITDALGLAKTTTHTADLKAFFSAKPEGCWKVAVKEGVVFARLHPKGTHLFRFDIIGDTHKRISELVPWSKDPVFLGYPYPLVLADQLARVSNEERGALRTRFQAAAGENWKAIAEEETAVNAHEILDKIQF